MVSELSEPVLQKLIRVEKIDALVWTPHSIPRQVPFMSEYKKNLALRFPEIDIVKAYSGDVPVAQKSLSKIEERVLNAIETMVIVPSRIKFKNVLIIDDAVGFAVVGSYKGFEVIKEV